MAMSYANTTRSPYAITTASSVLTYAAYSVSGTDVYGGSRGQAATHGPDGRLKPRYVLRAYEAVAYLKQDTAEAKVRKPL